jgi:hypothetical protein
MPPEDRKTVAPELSAAAKAFEGLGSLMSSLWGQQVEDLSTLFSQSLTGSFKVKDWTRDIITLWTRWFSMTATPWVFLEQLSTRPAGPASTPSTPSTAPGSTPSTAQVPTLFFIVDKDTETQGPQFVTPAFVLTDHLVEVTDLWPMDGNGGRRLENKPDDPNRQCVSVNLQQASNRVEVRLVSLLKQELHPGLYLGMVYARRPGESVRQPLALLCVLADLQAPRAAKEPLAT